MSEIKNFLKVKNISYEKMLELCSNNSLIIECEELYIIDCNLYFKINSIFSNNYAILFKKMFKLILNSSKGQAHAKNILCHLKILDLIEKLKLEKKYIFFDKEGKINFEKNIFDMDKYITNNEFILYELFQKFKKLLQNRNLVKI